MNKTELVFPKQFKNFLIDVSLKWKAPFRLNPFSLNSAVGLFRFGRYFFRLFPPGGKNMNIGSRSEAGKTKAAGVDGWREKNRSGWGKKSGILFRLKYDAMFQCFEVCWFFVFCLRWLTNATKWLFLFMQQISYRLLVLGGWIFNFR